MEQTIVDASHYYRADGQSQAAPTRHRVGDPRRLLRDVVVFLSVLWCGHPMSLPASDAKLGQLRGVELLTCLVSHSVTLARGQSIARQS